MKNKAAKKAIASYYILSLLLTLPLLIPIWFINNPLSVILYFLCFMIYMRIAINFAVRITIMPSLWKRLDAEAYAAIINAKPFRVHYSYKLNLYFAEGDYQAAYNIISSVLLQHKNAQQRIYGHLFLCRICFERGDYEGLKEHLEQIDKFFKYNTNLRLPKQSREAYEFYRAFSDGNYSSFLPILEKSIERYAKKKNSAYLLFLRQYQLAVTKRMMGEVDEAVALFEEIKESAPKLALSALAQKQIDYIFGSLEETAPEALAVTESYDMKPYNKTQRVFKWVALITASVGLLLIIISKIMMQLDTPEQENKDPEYMAKIESTLHDEYEKYQILGYLTVYTDDSWTETADTVFLVESDGCVDLHTLYLLNEEDGNQLNVENIQVDKLYEYDNIFSKRVRFVLTEKENAIPKIAKYYYQVDGYYFCVIDVSDS